jgi:pilus assembly protein CpaC
MKNPFTFKPSLPQWLSVIVAAVVLQSTHAVRADVTDLQEPLDVAVGQSQVIKVSEPITRLSIADPKIADIQLLNPYQVLVTGIATGSTGLIIWNDKGQMQQQEIDVAVSMTAVQNDLRQMFPNDNITVKSVGNIAVIQGQLSSADDVAPLHSYFTTQKVDYVDNTTLAGLQQVQLKVILAEANRTAIRALGINAFQTNSDFFGVSNIGPSNSTSGTPISIGAPAGASATSSVPFNFLSATGASPTTTMLLGVPPANLELFIQALVENEYVRILAEPTLVAESGQEASFLAGGEFPIPIVQGGGSTTGTSITITYEQYGVALNFRPVVLGDGRIQLHLAPSVSELSTAGELEISGFSIPAILTRQAETTLELRSGQSFAMAGLIDKQTQADSSEVPGLGALPVIGALFRSVRYEDDDTELVVLVTANLVDASSEAERPPLPGDLHVTPTDWELYAEGKIDGEAPPYLAPADASMFKSEGLDQLHGPGAWATYDAQPGPSQSEMDQTNSQAATASAPSTQ